MWRAGLRSPWFVAFAVLALTTASPRVAHADEQAEFEKARAAYVARNLDEAETRFNGLLDPKHRVADPVLLGQVRMYAGALALQKGSREEAVKLFERILLDDAQFEPDPLTFSSDVVNTFIDVRSRIRDALNNAAQAQAQREAARRAREDAERKRAAERLKVLERLASEDKYAVQHSRVVATLPFGVGQFQNGQPALGWIFLGVEAALTLGTIVTVPMMSYATDRQNEETGALANAYYERRRQIQTVNLSFVGALVGTVVIGAVQAHVAFVPEHVEVRRRPIPEARTPSPRFRWAASTPASPEGGTRPVGLVLGAGLDF